MQMEAKLKSNRDAVKDAVKEFNETEDALKALQSVGQIIGEVLKQLDENRWVGLGAGGGDVPRVVL